MIEAIKNYFGYPSHQQVSWVIVAFDANKRITPKVMYERWNEFCEAPKKPRRPPLDVVVTIFHILRNERMIFCYPNEVRIPEEDKTYSHIEAYQVMKASTPATK